MEELLCFKSNPIRTAELKNYPYAKSLKNVNNKSGVVVTITDTSLTNCDIINVLRNNLKPVEAKLCLNDIKKTKYGLVVKCDQKST